MLKEIENLSNIEMKKCSKCGEVKPANNEYFNNSKKSKDGLNNYCKKCVSDLYKENKKSKLEKIKEQGYEVNETKICSICNEEFPNTHEYFHNNKLNSDGLDKRCKACKSEKDRARNIKKAEKEGREVKHRLKSNKEGFKICSRCNEELPMNEEFFSKNDKIKCGFNSMCKKCTSEKAKEKRKKQAEEEGKKTREFYDSAKEGNKICRCCNRELPATLEYFQKDKTTNDGLNTRCKECLNKKRRDRAKNRAEKEGREFVPRQVRPKQIDPQLLIPTKENHKVCRACLIEKPHEEFFKKKRVKDGYDTYCKKCSTDMKHRRERGEEALIEREQKKLHKLFKRLEKQKLRIEKKTQKEKESKEKRLAKKKEKEEQKKLKEIEREQKRLAKKKEKEIEREQKRLEKQKQKEDKIKYLEEQMNNLVAGEGKVCTCCGIEKPMTSDFFRPTNKNGSGFLARCRKCISVEKRKYDHTRDVRKKANGGTYTTKQWEESLKYFNNRCAYSGVDITEVNYHIEHIKPISKGGTSWIWNIVPSLDVVNISKNNRNMEEWYREQDYFSEERLQKIYEYQEYMFNKYGYMEKELQIAI